MNAFGVSPTGLIILARFVTGLSQGVFYPSLASITVRRIPKTEKGFFTGFVNSGASIGSAMTGLFGSIVLEAVSWQFVFLGVGSLSLLWIVWLRYSILQQEEDESVLHPAQPQVQVCQTST